MATTDSAFVSHDHRGGGLLNITLPVMEPSVGPAFSPVPDRPASALARGVQITEFKEQRVNPDPVPAEETEQLMEEFLSPRKLRDLTGIDDLNEVKYLELKVDTRETSLGNFGAHLPNLSQLRLSNSIITTVRDLGSSLDQLRVLWMARCGLEDIDGLASMSNLQELYLAYNEIYDISPCSMLDKLKILDLEGNNIDDVAQIGFLSLCQNLKNLTLDGNPVCTTPSPDEESVDYDYRHTVKERVPQVQYLDDEPLLDTSDNLKRAASAFDDDWRLIEELMEDGTLVGGNEDVIDNIGRPGSSIRPATGYRPGSALKQQVRVPLTSSGMRPPTGLRPGSRQSGYRPGTGRVGSARPGSARPTSARPSSRGGAEEAETTEDASDLTLGGVVCGNPSKALKSRQRHLLDDTNTEKLNKLFAQHENNPHAKPIERRENVEEKEDLNELFSELSEWKKIHQERQKELEAEKAPQILRIEHDDAMPVSDDESVDSALEDDLTSPEESPSHHADSYHPRQHTGPRPRSGADFLRSARYNPETPEQDSGRPETPSSRRHLLQYDDSFDAQDDTSPQSYSPDPQLVSSNQRFTPHSPLVPKSDSRPTSNPALRSGQFRFGGNVDKSQPKTIDRLNPVVRASIHSPEQRVTDDPRATTSDLPPNTIRPIRRGQLSGVPLLPSKMPGKFK